MSARPTSIRIFLADGSPEGIRIVDKSNWVGRAVVSSRAQAGQALRREELSRPGVYLLLGPGDGGAERLYVGEADILRERLKQHATRKDFWTRFVAFTSSDESLNKAVVRYLEARLIGLAKAANQWELDNGAEPSQPPLSEADRADAEWFLAEMLVIYRVLGIDAFEAAAADTAASEASDELTLSARGAEARGREVRDGFIVLAGSRARASETASIHAYMRDLRAQLCERGVLVPDGAHLLFAQDYRFPSSSTAAGVLVGGAANGRMAWKNRDGRTLKAIQDARTDTA
ncbi:MAG: hypothetical protein B7Z66_15190 [Chromatiales bacterium 21-64-14]|nr:MAG: hypothetical protein B7Z66_15190 [Chromatiales bacterium 21-64-14]HQU17206.1 GIY-YIG nuclease family protein [Gammaproteobacteria bacterium]